MAVREPELMAVLLVGCTLIDLLMASFVWARRDGGSGKALAAVMVASALWAGFYAAELVLPAPFYLVAGDLKYLGIGLLPASWVAFTLHWTGRGQLASPRLIIALLIEPILVLLMMAIPELHHLVRYIDPTPPPGAPDRYVTGGPVFWVHLGYVMITLVAATIFLLVNIARRAHTRRGQALVLALAPVLPFVASVGFNFYIPPFIPYDLTPIGFTVACAVLTWGLLEERLLKLAPIAHTQVVAGMPDGVIILDNLNHVVETNPAAVEALGWQHNRASWRAQELPPALAAAVTRLGASDVRLEVDGQIRMYEAQVTDLPDGRGHEGGRLVLLRDISERRRLERQRATMLAEQARVAETLSRSLRPSLLPTLTGVALGATYRPAGDGHEIGGDFYDVYPVGEHWAFSLGDVSGKGARSAAVTALARYTLRALTREEDTPSQTVSSLNTQVISETEDQEVYLTLVHGRMFPRPDGKLEVKLTLGGHPRPVLVPADGRPITPIGEPGTAVGLLPDIETSDTDVLLAPMDALVMFTDGVTEARRGRDFFGEEGLVEVLEELRGADASVIADGLLEAVLSYQAFDAADDIAVLVIQAPGVPASSPGQDHEYDAGPADLPADVPVTAVSAGVTEARPVN